MQVEIRYGRKRLHYTPEQRAAHRLARKQKLAAMPAADYAAYQAHQTQLQRDRRERIKKEELAAAWARHEALLVGVSLELGAPTNAG